MGICKRCNTKAGIFKDIHESCWREAEAAIVEIATVLVGALTTALPQEELINITAQIRERGRLRVGEGKQVILEAIDRALMPLAQANPCNNEEAERIGEIYKLIEPTWFENVQRMTAWGGYISLLHSNVIFQVLHGENPYAPPSLFDVFRLGKGEHPILKRGATLAEYRSVTGGVTYQSVSIPLGSGMYYRLGASAPRTKQTGLVPIDQGTILITTQAVYFGGEQTTFRIPYPSMLRLECFLDAVAIHQNHGRGQVFIPNKLGDMDEGWYFYNLISALAARVS